MAAQLHLHPVWVLLRWEDTRGGGIADKGGTEGTGCRQVSRMQSGGKEVEGSKRKEKKNTDSAKF